MFKLLRRFVAYFIDMMVILIIVQTIASIPFINKNMDKYSKEYDKYLDSSLEYSNFLMDLNESYKDKKLSNKEYDKLVEDNEEFKDLLDTYYKNDKLSNKNYDKLVKELNDNYLEEYKDVYYKLDKNSIVFNISYVIVTILYFVGFNLITDGVTLGKKLVRLKIVNNKDSSNKVNWISYLIRCFMLYQPIYYLSKVVFVNFLNISDYYTVTNTIYDVHSYLLFIILGFIAVRMDGRGLHDIFSNTRVIALDKTGKEVC